MRVLRLHAGLTVLGLHARLCVLLLHAGLYVDDRLSLHEDRLYSDTRLLSLKLFGLMVPEHHLVDVKAEATIDEEDNQAFENGKANWQPIDCVDEDNRSGLADGEEDHHKDFVLFGKQFD